MLRNKIMWVLSLVVIASMVLTACGGTVQTVEVVTTVEVEKEVVQTQVVKETEIVEVEVEVAAPTEVPEVITRTGGWLDLVVFTEQNSADAAISQIQSGDIDVYAYSVSGPERFKKVAADPNLSYSNAFGSYTELTFNPAVCTDDDQAQPLLESQDPRGDELGDRPRLRRAGDLRRSGAAQVYGLQLRLPRLRQVR